MSTVGRAVRDFFTDGARAAPSRDEQLAELRRIAGARGWPADNADYAEAYGWVEYGDPGLAATYLARSGLPGADQAAGYLRSVVAVDQADRARDQAVADDLAATFDFTAQGGGLTGGGKNLLWIGAAVVAGLLLLRR